MKLLSGMLAGVVVVTLTACGGGGSSQASAPVVPPTVSSLANICTLEGEKAWVHAYLNDVYIWYSEIKNINPSDYAGVGDYFEALLVRSKDSFSAMMPATKMQTMLAGQDIGYGMSFAATANGGLVVTKSEPYSPAGLAKLGRGAQIVGINGRPVNQISAANLESALFPTNASETLTLEVRDPGAVETRFVALSSAIVDVEPVPQAKILTNSHSEKIGYLVFDTHVEAAKSQLIAAMKSFSSEHIVDLVLDLRNNEGGIDAVAAQLGSMIGGGAVSGKVFMKSEFNSKHPEKTSAQSSTMLFPGTDDSGQNLPALGLSRVFVITSGSTCSASELIINGLKPFVNVITVGESTCGKPYGFNPVYNCGKGYAVMEIKASNALGQGDYVNGFAPTCPVIDDFSVALASPNELLLKVAMGYQETGACPTVTGLGFENKNVRWRMSSSSKIKATVLSIR